MSHKFCFVVPWHRQDLRDKWLEAWGLKLDAIPPWLFLQQDRDKSGCGATKNAGVQRAMQAGADVVVILDDDVYPLPGSSIKTLEDVAAAHLVCLEPQEFPLMEVMTNPPARGVPYFNRTAKLPVAISAGWWAGMPDRDAARQLVEGVTKPMYYRQEIVYGRPAMICGMNMAFRPSDWWPWCQFLPVSRLDDVFQSWLWTKEIARRNHCINFKGPTLLHSRASDVFSSLIDEAKWLRFNETIWSDIWLHPSNDYATLRALIPVP